MVTKDELLKSILIFDIECYSEYDIRNEFDKYVSDAKPKWIGFYSYKTNQYYEIPVLGNEDLIKSFFKEHKYSVGFNNKEFDTPILRNNELIPKYFRELDMMKIYSLHTVLSIYLLIRSKVKWLIKAMFTYLIDSLNTTVVFR